MVGEPMKAYGIDHGGHREGRRNFVDSREEQVAHFSFASLSFRFEPSEHAHARARARARANIHVHRATTAPSA